MSGPLRFLSSNLVYPDCFAESALPMGDLASWLGSLSGFPDREIRYLPSFEWEWVAVQAEFHPAQQC